MMNRAATWSDCADLWGKATVGYFEIVTTRLRSIATSLSAFQIKKLGFFSPY
jgi:hypothetical protein